MERRQSQWLATDAELVLFWLIIAMTSLAAILIVIVFIIRIRHGADNQLYFERKKRKAPTPSANNTAINTQVPASTRKDGKESQLLLPDGTDYFNQLFNFVTRASDDDDYDYEDHIGGTACNTMTNM